MRPLLQLAALLILLNLALQPATSQDVTEKEFLETGVPLTFAVGGKIGLLVTKDLKGLCTVTLIDDFGDWLFGEKQALMFSAFGGEQCERLWRLAWDSRSSQARPVQSQSPSLPQRDLVVPASDAAELKNKPDASGPYVRWAADNEYSDTFLYNGFNYKTIQFNNFFLAVSQPTPRSLGFRNHATFANVLLENKEDRRLDIDPAHFLLQCGTSNKPETLKYYLPDGLGSHTGLFRAHTLFKDDEMKGTVVFKGNCPGGVVQIPIGKTIFEFPFP